jgi:choline dehydrogenase-like flavoprotein
VSQEASAGDAERWVPEDPERGDWDVVVVGTGMGGATAGYALARRGRRVLFLEKGRFLHRDPGAVRGELTDQGVLPEDRLRRGRWPLPIQGTTERGDVEFFAPLGCGSGGSTILYAATLERFFPADFRPRQHFPEVSDSTLPEAWPIAYEDLAPFYREAEQLYRVCGTPDPLFPDDDAPLRPPPPIGGRDRAVHDLFERNGLHPYRVHMGCEFLEDCTGCGGLLCMRRCKSDAASICLLPALDHFGAQILPQCEVIRLEADRRSVTRVRARWRGREISVGGRCVVLAAGALMSPVLLLQSASDVWPRGLANGTDLVGRNLMVHSGDMIAVRPERSEESVGPTKSLSLNDFYFCDGRKLGNLQSVGIPVSGGVVLTHLRSVVDKSASRWLKASRPFLRFAATFGAHYFRNAVVFGSIVEDLPYHHNRIVVDRAASNGMRFEYRYPDELRERNALFRRRLADVLGGRRVVSLTRDSNLNFGHPCGTVRFGDDPAASVLDRDNRAHDVPNLFVVDASFFPSSGGTNPSLTIAANALRVALAIDRQLA